MGTILCNHSPQPLLVMSLFPPKILVSELCEVLHGIVFIFYIVHTSIALYKCTTCLFTKLYICTS